MGGLVRNGIKIGLIDQTNDREEKIIIIVEILTTTRKDLGAILWTKILGQNSGMQTYGQNVGTKIIAQKSEFSGKKRNFGVKIKYGKTFLWKKT